MNALKRALVVAAVIGATTGSALAAGPGPHFGSWSTAQKIDEINGNDADLNTPSQDGCPIQSPDGLKLYIATNRPGGKGGLDIWMATRDSKESPWGAAVSLPEPINSAADDFCPTPVGKRGLYFVSRRVITGVTCGMGDIYFARRDSDGTWGDPTHFSCAPEGPNSALDEQGPSYAQGRLYFSSSSAAVPGDLFMSMKNGSLSFGPASPIAELNTSANDIQPNVRKDGREVVFSSNRAGGLGGQDIWSATRASVDEPWSAAVNLGSGVNTGLGESRPSLSRDALQLLFGRAGPVGTGEGGSGLADVYVATRENDDH
jgi:Tol biopolymer transport system component